MHLTKRERADVLMSVLVIGFCWMHKVYEKLYPAEGKALCREQFFINYG